jgi:hypothetical protein|tara:strand:+ start:182 stop:778 length:597 start_codon:yes stop_codon:yes gene_type:complete
MSATWLAIEAAKAAKVQPAKLKTIGGEVDRALHRGMGKGAKDVKRLAQVRLPGSAGDKGIRYKIVGTGRHRVQAQFSMTYIPRWFEFGTEPHYITPRGWRRSRRRRGQQRITKTSRRTLAREKAKYGVRRSKFALTIGDNARAYAAHPGQKATPYVAKSIVSERNAWARTIRGEITRATVAKLKSTGTSASKISSIGK